MCDHNVLSWRDGVEPITSLIVGHSTSDGRNRNELAAVRSEYRLQERHGNIRDRIAMLLDHTAGNRSAARQGDVDALECLTRLDRQNGARLLRPPLSIF